MRAEIMAQLPLLIAQGVREELDRRGYRDQRSDAKANPRPASKGSMRPEDRTSAEQAAAQQ